MYLFDGLHSRKTLMYVLALFIVSLTACAGSGNSQPPKVAILSPTQNSESMVGENIVIQGQADGSALARVDVVIDSKTIATLNADDKSKGVSSFPVLITFTTQIVGAHYVQFNIYGTDDKLLAKSDVVIFSTKAAPLPTSTPEQPTPTPVPPTPEPTRAITPSAPTTAITPSLTISNEFANIRSGPGTDYAILGQLNQNDKAAVSGKNADGTWWQIAYDKGTNGLGWVRGDLVQANAAAAGVAAVQAPPAPTSPPAPVVVESTATPPNAATATPSGPVCGPGQPDWRGSNPNYPFCAKQDPTWADPASEYTVYDNGRDGPLSISWYMYGSNISQVFIHFDQSATICGFSRPAQNTVNTQVPAAGKFDFNVLQFPYGGTYIIYWSIKLTDGRVVQWGEKKLCIR